MVVKWLYLVLMRFVVGLFVVPGFVWLFLVGCGVVLFGDFVFAVL